ALLIRCKPLAEGRAPLRQPRTRSPVRRRRPGTNTKDASMTGKGDEDARVERGDTCAPWLRTSALGLMVVSSTRGAWRRPHGCASPPERNLDERCEDLGCGGDSRRRRPERVRVGRRAPRGVPPENPAAGPPTDGVDAAAHPEEPADWGAVRIL